ncbi:MAG TPA: hypothetical protein VEZ14_07070 [Dehalococcoidia bacterium]|nr:hypothetical protein [Dehalococcoidia bacterium]
MVYWSTGPAAAESVEQTVSATVSSQSVAISVSPNVINYGTVGFEQSRSSLAAEAGNVTFVATNTGNVPELFSIRGSAAAGDGFTWDLTPSAVTCGALANMNKFRHRVNPLGGTPIFLTYLAEYLAVDPIAPSAGTSFTTEIYLPCLGSNGVGKTASTNITVVATAP